MYEFDEITEKIGLVSASVWTCGFWSSLIVSFTIGGKLFYSDPNSIWITLVLFLSLETCIIFAAFILRKNNLSFS